MLGLLPIILGAIVTTLCLLFGATEALALLMGLLVGVVGSAMVAWHRLFIPPASRQTEVEPLDQWSRGCRAALVMAGETARREHHRSITDWHLVLGLAGARECRAAGILADSGLDSLRMAGFFHERVSPYLARGDGPARFDDTATACLQAAVEEAVNRGADQVSSTHLLLACTRDEISRAAPLLRQEGCGRDVVEARLLQDGRQA